MTIYKSKKNAITSCAVILISITLMSLYFYYYSPLSISTFLLHLLLILVVWMGWPEIITDANAITKRSFVQTQNVCWDWIYDVRTVCSSSDGSYCTVLSYAKDPNNKPGSLMWMFKRNPQHGTFTIGEGFTDYIILLKEIKDKARNAEFDNETKKLMENGINISTARKLFWIFAVVFFVVVLIYLFLKS